MVLVGVVLAGGKSSRMGRNKALLTLDGMAIIERQLRLLGETFRHCIIVADDQDEYENLGACVIPDVMKGHGPLAGVHAALKHIASHHRGADGIFVLACDMPFVKEGVVRAIAELGSFDAVVPFIDGTYHPLCASYALSCLPVVERHIREGKLDMASLVRDVNARILHERELERIDPGLRSFLNINTLEEFKKAAQSFRWRG